MRAIMIVAMLASCAAGDEPKKPEKPAASKPTDNPPRPGMMSPEQIVDSILQRMDTNKDGKISKDEARNRIADSFDQIDTNKDGFLDRTELLAMARRFPPMPRPGPFGGPGGPPMGRPDPLDFDALDKNADGRLTREELRGSRFLEVFDKIDANKDGKIDPKEWQQYHGLKK